jgi:hypothetical protein
MARIEMPHGKDFSSSTFTEERNRCAIRLGYTKCSCAHTRRAWRRNLRANMIVHAWADVWSGWLKFVVWR